MVAHETTIAERLRSAREVAGLTQGQAAKLLGLHRPTVSEIEAGRRKVSAEELGQFGDIYGTVVLTLDLPLNTAKYYLILSTILKYYKED